MSRRTQRRNRNRVQQEGFAQVPHVITFDSRVSDGALRLYLVLLKYAQQKDKCWPGIERLAKDLDKSEPTVERRLAELVEHGLIDRNQRGHGLTALTRIEDVGLIYNSINDDVSGSIRDDAPSNPIRSDEAVRPITNDEASSIKSDEGQAPSKVMDKEHEEKETDMDGGGYTDIGQSLQMLLEFGVHQSMAKHLVERCDRTSIERWIRYTEQAAGLHSPVAFLVSRLKAGEPVPTMRRSASSEQERRSYLDWLNPDVVVSRSEHRGSGGWH
jgi:predicted transcriptional regulator